MNKNSPRTAQDEGPGPHAVADDDRAPQLALGGALRRAWVGYQQLLDAEMAREGFDDRRFPDGRVLRLCAREQAVTASRIGRELGITRQGAGKIVNDLRDRGYLSLGASPSDAREKVITLTPKAQDYLSAQYRAARRIEEATRERIGVDASQSLARLLEALGGTGQPRLRDYLDRKAHRDSRGQGGELGESLAQQLDDR